MWRGGPPISPCPADSAGCAESARLSNFSRCLRACSKVISRRAASAASAQLQHIPPPPLGSQRGGRRSREAPPPALAPLPPAEKAHPRVGSGGRYNVEGGTTRNAAVGQCWLVGGWIGPIPALSSTSRSLSSQDHPPSSPQPGTDPAVPLSASRRAGPRAAPSGVSAAPGGLPGSPPQCPLAGRGSGDPRPSSSLLSQRCGQVAASPHLPPPLLPVPPLLRAPGGAGAPLRTMKAAGTARLPLPPPPPLPASGRPQPQNLRSEGAGRAAPRAESGGRGGIPRALPLSRSGRFPKDQLQPVAPERGGQGEEG